MAADPVAGYPARLALALKPGKRLVRVMLYELLGGAATALPRGATAMCTGQVELAEPLSIKVPLPPPRLIALGLWHASNTIRRLYERKYISVA